jgi:CRP-like cAMP-binding protein
MEKKTGQVPEILENVKQDIAKAEEKRKELRFSYNLNNFEQGNPQVLKNDEFFTGLESILLIHSPENQAKKIQLCMLLGESALAEETPVKERALALLSSATKFHLDHNEKPILIVLGDGLCNWLEIETEMLPGFPVMTKRFEDVLVWFLNNACWVEAEEMVVLLHRIQEGSLIKSGAIKSLTSHTLQNLEKRGLVEKLTEEYLLDNEQQHLLQNILRSIGQKAAVYLLNRLLHSLSRNERLSLLNLIPTFGKAAIPALEKCLENNPPWAVVRNIICIISGMGLDTNFALIERYFDHSDERVQLEMIGCAVKLGGQMLNSRLIAGLGMVNDRLKIHILHLLVERVDHDENVLTALLKLAEKRTAFSAHSEHDLLLAIITALKSFPYQKSVEQLKKMHDDYTGREKVEQLLLHIDEALKVIEPKIRHNLQYINNSQDVVSFDNDPVQQQQAFEKVRKAEEEIQVLVRAGKIQQAGQLIYDQGIAAAKIKDFSVAELLRDRLLEINPMAFSEVIQLGEFIDEQKSTSITSHHLEIWSELYEEMTTEEFNKLYYSLRQENYHKGDIIVRSGETDNNLYFLNSGYISLSCVAGGKELFLKRMQPSNVLGGDQFFSLSVWTVTLKALNEIQVHVLGYEVFKKIAEDYPGIEDKLRKYCQKHAQVPELLKMSGDDRREYPRYPMSLHTRNILLDPFSNKGKQRFNGELFDISRQGLAFTIRISNTDNARLLLGRHIMTTIIIGDEELTQENGVIVGVRLYEAIMQDYSVHVKLSKKIDEAIFKRIVSIAE